MTEAVVPGAIAVLRLQPNDILLVNDHAIDPAQLHGLFPCPVIPVQPRPGMTVADEIAVIRKEI